MPFKRPPKTPSKTFHATSSRPMLRVKNFPVTPTKRDQIRFLLFLGIFSHFSLVFSLAATHSKYTPGSPQILAHTQRETKRSTKAPEIKKDRYPTLGIEPAASTHRALQGDTCSSTPRRLYELEPKTKLWRCLSRTSTSSVAYDSLCRYTIIRNTG